MPESLQGRVSDKRRLIHYNIYFQGYYLQDKVKY